MIDKYCLYIAEKPSVARAFADVLGGNPRKLEGYLQGDNFLVTWCLGHLVSMSYPDKYDEKYKKWRMETLPFIPDEYLYEVISGVKKQFNTVKKLLNSKEVERIYVCTDSGREGEYIYRLVSSMAGVKGKEEMRVWINSQTKDEIIRGIKEAKPLSEYDRLSSCAYLRAKEDYLMGINFSRVLSIKYGGRLASLLNKKYMPISVGRVMTCVLGMVARREREIRNFVKKPFYRVFADLEFGEEVLPFEWKNPDENAAQNGFDTEEKAKEFIQSHKASPEPFVIDSVSKKKEKKNPPFLYNLAELQNDCSRVFKISPDQTLNIAQSLYEKGLTTYPRTDARVLSTPVAKDIGKNLNGLFKNPEYAEFVREIHSKEYYKKLVKSRYVDDKKITDHFAIIPTGEGLKALNSLSAEEAGVYDMVVKRFLCIFYPESVSEKITVTASHLGEKFTCQTKTLVEEGYLKVTGYKPGKEEISLEAMSGVKKGQTPPLKDMRIKKGETTPPKRYTSGSMILAMENAGKLIEDESLREQITGSGIGTSATRAGIIEKLIKNKYLKLNKKTQVLSPTLAGEMIYDIVYGSITPLLNPELTASWEKGLTMVERGEVTDTEYMEKLSGFVVKYTNMVKSQAQTLNLEGNFKVLAGIYGDKKYAGSKN